MKEWLSTVFSGLSKPKPHDIENLRQGLLRIEDRKLKGASIEKFNDIVIDHLTEKGWPLSNADDNLARTLDILRFQCDLPVNFKNCAEEFSVKSHEFHDSMDFIMEHKHDLYQVAGELRNQPMSIKEDKPTVILYDKRSENPEPEIL